MFKNPQMDRCWILLAKLESYQPTKVDVHSFIGICKTLKNLILKDHISF